MQTTLLQTTERVLVLVFSLDVFNLGVDIIVAKTREEKNNDEDNEVQVDAGPTTWMTIKDTPQCPHIPDKTRADPPLFRLHGQELCDEHSPEERGSLQHRKHCPACSFD